MVDKSRRWENVIIIIISESITRRRPPLLRLPLRPPRRHRVVDTETTRVHVVVEDDLQTIGDYGAVDVVVAVDGIAFAVSGAVVWVVVSVVSSELE